RVDNAGTLVASGLIAGEAILGLVWAGLQFTPPSVREHLQIIAHPSYAIGILVLIFLGFVLIRTPHKSAGKPAEIA
ncbi:MAG: OPT family oligopeptide transporter, partial [Bryobacteraceae bacterium]